VVVGVAVVVGASGASVHGGANHPQPKSPPHGAAAVVVVVVGAAVVAGVVVVGASGSKRSMRPANGPGGDGAAGVVGPSVIPRRPAIASITGLGAGVVVIPSMPRTVSVTMSLTMSTTRLRAMDATSPPTLSSGPSVTFLNSKFSPLITNSSRSDSF